MFSGYIWIKIVLQCKSTHSGIKKLNLGHLIRNRLVIKYFKIIETYIKKRKIDQKFLRRISSSALHEIKRNCDIWPG